MSNHPDTSDVTRPALIHGGEDISPVTLRRVELATGGMATRAVAMMEDLLPWFRTLTAEERSWVTLVAQAGIGGYVPWVASARSDLRLTDTVFGNAPRDLLRSVSLRRTVELVRVAIDVAEERIPALGDDPDEVVALRDSLLRYSREIAFAAAAVYATAAETRGAWDARVEAALVDGIVRGEDPDSLASRAATMGWDPTGPVAVLVGTARVGGRDGPDPRHVTEWAHTHAVSALSGVQGGRLVVVLSGWADDGADTGASPTRGGLLKEHPFPADVEGLFADGPIVHGPPGLGLTGAIRSSAEAFAGLRVAHAWSGGSGLLSAADLLVERVLAGDSTAIRRLVDTIWTPLAAATTPLLETLDGYLEHGAALDPAARSLFIHSNTLRYRLHRVAELTGVDPWNPRDVAVLRVALILGRLRS